MVSGLSLEAAAMSVPDKGQLTIRDAVEKVTKKVEIGVSDTLKDLLYTKTNL